MQESIRRAQDQMGRDVEEASSRMQADYDALLRKLEEQRERLRRDVERQWSDFRESDTKHWVDYSPKTDSRSTVDFEKGKVEIEVLVPAEGGKEKAKKAAEAKLAERAQAVLNEKDKGGGPPILKDQLPPQSVKPEALAPKLVVEDKPVVGKDGKPRLKVKVTLDLVPDHLRVRAQRYHDDVVAAAKKHDLDPALVFAIMQTESEFNPRARSQAPAFGLMQLMPKTAALEAHQYLYKREKILTPDELYDPKTNITLGTTYLHMLRTRHFPKIKDERNKQTLMIAAYNCGPGCVRKNVLAKGDVDALTNDQLVALIQRAAPRETQLYVPRVQSRIPAYK